MRKLIGLLGLRDVVWVGLQDGDYFLRLVRHGRARPNNPFLDQITDPPRFFVYGFVSSLIGTLLHGGSIDTDGCYMVRWKPYRVKSEELLALYAESGATKQ